MDNRIKMETNDIYTSYQTLMHYYRYKPHKFIKYINSKIKIKWYQMILLSIMAFRKDR